MTNRSADRQAEGAWRYRAVFGMDEVIGEENASRIIADRSARQQLPRFAIGVNRPAADHPRIAEIKTLVAWPIDPPVELADKHCLALVDRDLRRADMHLERHDGLLPRSAFQAKA